VAQTAANSPWRELATRLLLHPYPGGPSVEVELLLAALPEGIRDLPLPRGARLLGSARHSMAGRFGYVEAVLDADGTPQDVVSRYRSDLLQRGWSVFPTPGPPRGGFTSGVAGEGEALQRQPDGPVVMIAALGREQLPCDVRLRVDFAMARQAPSHAPGLPPGVERMPALRPPPGVPISYSGSGGGDRDWTSYATAQTTLAVAELETHLAAQMTSSGWTRLAGSADDVIAWSSWRADDDPSWRGLLMVLGAFAEDQRSLVLRLEAGDGADRRAAGYSVALGG
jgi:hypothetical protein